MSDTSTPTLTLIEALLFLPLVGVPLPDDTRQLHAVTTLPVKDWETATTATAACGATVKLLACPWPVPLKRAHAPRCAECRSIVGGKAKPTARRWWADR